MIVEERCGEEGVIGEIVMKGERMIGRRADEGSL